MNRIEYEQLLAEQPDVSIRRDVIGDFHVNCQESQTFLLLDIYIFVRVTITGERKVVFSIMPQEYKNSDPDEKLFTFLWLEENKTIEMTGVSRILDIDALLRKVLFGLRLYKAYRELERAERSLLWRPRVSDFRPSDKSLGDAKSLIEMEHIISEITRVFQLTEGR